MDNNSCSDNRRERIEKVKKIIIPTAAVLVIVILAAGFGIYNLLRSFNPLPGQSFIDILNFSTRGSINVLFLGSDEDQYGISRSDTIILAGIDFDNDTVALLSIPRDTRVRISENSDYIKINEAYARNGGELASRTVENLLDIPVDAYVSTDFSGFKDVIDVLGGVTIDVERSMNYVDEAGDLYIDISPGTHRFDGQEALNYVRFREEMLGDIGRIERQQKFIQATIDEAFQIKTLPKLPELIEQLMGSVETSLTPQEMLRIGQLAAGMDEMDIEMNLLPGTPEYIDEISYWVHDEDAARILVDELLRSGEYFENREINIAIYNGNGIPGMASDIADQLGRRGYRIDMIANADHFEYDKSQVILKNEDKIEAGRKLAHAFEVRLKTDYKDDFEQDIKIILGKDRDRG